VKPTKMLVSASQSPEAAAIRKAIGAGPDEPVEVTTPQFERTAGMPKPSQAPTSRAGWEKLRSKSAEELWRLGFGRWGNVDESDPASPMLMLIPGEWYQAIPSGFRVTDINGYAEGFVAGVVDDDIRFGCLPYGIPVRE